MTGVAHPRIMAFLMKRLRSIETSVCGSSIAFSIFTAPLRVVNFILGYFDSYLNRCNPPID
jgi:hypothetical protein